MISTKALLGVSLIALSTPFSAMAQDAPAQDTASASEDDNTIIVQARRRDESVQDVPAVVNAVTSEEVTKLNLREFTEVKDLVPGLQLSNNANGIGGNAQIRGVNFDINASGNNPTVEFYMNDAPITAGVVLQQMYDIGQIEVLRGPQGTLRGRASPSGSITVTTKKPDLYRAGGYASATGTDTGTINLNGAVGLPIIEGIAAIRVAGLYDVGDGNRIRTIDKRVDGRDPYGRTASGRVSALITPADWLRLEGTYQKIDRVFRNFNQVESFSVVNSAAPASPTLITADDRLTNQAWPRRVTQKFDIYNWRAEVSAIGQQLIYQGQYYTQHLRSRESQDRANLFPTTDVNQNTASNIKSQSHEIRLQNQERIADIFDYAIGYFDNTNDTPTSLNSPTVVRLPLAFGGGVAQIVQTQIGRLGNSHEKSFFGNVTAHVGDFQVSGGLRHIDYEDVGQLIVGGNLLTTDRHADKKWIYTASAQYNFSPDVMVYANTGSSYRPGITAVGDFNIAPSARERSFLNLSSESSKSYELGLKSTLLDHKLRFNLSAYQQKFTGYPYRSPGGVYYINTVALRNAQGQVTGTAQQVGIFNFVAAVPVTVRGVEAEVGFKPLPGWDISLVASYADGQIKNGLIPCTDLNGDGKPDVVTVAPTLAQLQSAAGANNLSQCTVSQRSSNQAPFSATIQSEYNFALSGKVDAYLRGLLSFNGASQGDPTNFYDQNKAFGLLNLFTGIRDPQGMWEVSLYAKNIFDTTKVLTRTDPLSTSYQQLPGAIIGGVPTITGSPSAATTTSTYTGITTTPPREFGLNVRFAFGSR